MQCPPHGLICDLGKCRRLVAGPPLGAVPPQIRHHRLPGGLPAAWLRPTEKSEQPESAVVLL